MGRAWIPWRRVFSGQGEGDQVTPGAGKHYSCVRCEGSSPEEPHGADGVGAIYSTVKVSTSRGSWWQRCQLQGSSILGKHTKEREAVAA